MHISLPNLAFLLSNVDISYITNFDLSISNFDEHDNNIEWLKDNGYIGQSNINPESRLHLLKALVKWYNKMLHTTLYPFGTWFAVHWILYTITSLMSISESYYVAESIILELYMARKNLT